MSFLNSIITATTRVKTAVGDIAKALRAEITNFFRKKAPPIKTYPASNELLRNLRDEVVRQIKESKEFKSLVNNGELNVQLGLPKENRRWVMQFLPRIVASCVNISGIPGRDNYTIQINLKESPILRILKFNRDDTTKYTYFSNFLQRLNTVPWFKWLMGIVPASTGASLYRGVPHGKHSRSGKAVMIFQNDPVYGKLFTTPWKLPSIWQGSIEDNFITRAIEKAVSTTNIERILREEFS